MTPPITSGDVRTVSREDADWQEMVYCQPMRTYVPVEFCLRGGPMNADGPCEWLVEIRDRPERVVIHAIPKAQAIERHVRMRSARKETR
jgi:hypothetical protein